MASVLYFIAGNIEYTCPASNDCEINKRRRKACQACRFQKCIRMGMLKEGVRLDRVRGGRQKYRRVTPYTTTPASANNTGAQAGSTDSNNVNPHPVKKVSLEGMQTIRPPSDQCLVEVGIQYPTYYYSLVFFYCFVADNKILSTLGQCEPEMLTTVDILWPEGDVSSMDPSLRILCTLSELYDRELVAAIGWAKQIPGEILNFYFFFPIRRIWSCRGNNVSREWMQPSESNSAFVTWLPFVMGKCLLFSSFLDVTGFLEMPLNDQMRLLQTSWPEVLTLSLAFRSIPLNSTNPKLQWSADFGMNEKEARECGMEELFFQVGGSIRSNLFLHAHI